MMDRKRTFWELLKPEHAKAQAFCRKLCGNRDEGDDLYQTALLKALKNFGQLREDSLFKSWLYRIIINAFKNSVRSSLWKRMVPMTKAVEETQGAKSNQAHLAAKARVEIAFKAITAKERALITLFELEGWSVAELAGMHGKKEGAIKAQLSRIRSKMRQALVKHLGSDIKTTVNLLNREAKICVAAKPLKD